MVDEEVNRRPALVRKCDAASCAAAVASPTDPFGLSFTQDHRPKVKLYGAYTSTDSHSVNKLLAKWLSTEMERRRQELGTVKD